MGIDMLPHEDRYRRTADFITCLNGRWTFDERTYEHFGFTGGPLSVMGTCAAGLRAG